MSDESNVPVQDDNQSSSEGRLPKRDTSLFIIPPHPNTVFNDVEFLDLLEGSISLTLEEKKRVVQAIPRLDQAQVNELIDIFHEEREKFSTLEKEFSQDVEKLKREREKELELLALQQEEANEDSGVLDEAEALKRKLRGE